MNGSLRRHGPGRPEKTRVPQRIVAAAEALVSDERRVRTVLAADAVGVGSLVRPRILEIAPDDGVRGRDHEGQLRGTQVAVRVGVGGVARFGPGGHGAVDRVLHAVVGAKKPEAVFDGIAAEGKAVVETGVARHERVEVRVFRMLVRGLEPVGVVVGEGVAVEFVAARLGDDVDDPAGGTPVLGLIAAGLDLELLDELVVELLALGAVLDAVGHDAVDDEAVLEPGRPVDHHGVGEVRGVGRLLRDARGNLHDRRVVPPGGQGVDLSAVDVVADRRRIFLDERGHSRDDDLGRRGRAQLDVPGGAPAERDDDLLLRAGEPLEHRRNLVGPGRQENQAVDAVGVGDRASHAREGRAAAFHRDAGKGTAAFVGHGSDDVAGGLRGEQEGTEDHRRQSEGEPEASHGTSQKNLQRMLAQRLRAASTSTPPRRLW